MKPSLPLRRLGSWAWALAATAVLAVSPGWAQCPAPKAGPPLSVLIVTGGHDYEPLEFFRAFDAMPGIRYQHVFTRGRAIPQAYPRGGLGKYDVVLFYDMEPGNITPEWRDLLERGRGIVFLHHALGSFPGGTEFRAIAGGQANFKDERPAGVVKSPYEHNVVERFTITDRSHPVTCGTPDFSMMDEGYDQVVVEPGAQVLMTSDFPKANPAVAWTWTYQGRRTFTLQPGHGSLGMPADRGPSAFENQTFLGLLQRAIFWAGGRL